MAAKKTTDEKEVIEVTEAPKEKMVKIKLPRERDSKENAVFVSVNERTWLIQKGVEVEVPECVAELLALQEKALDEAYEYESAVVKG
jgi:hypothetical protein